MSRLDTAEIAVAGQHFVVERIALRGVAVDVANRQLMLLGQLVVETSGEVVEFRVSVEGKK